MPKINWKVRIKNRQFWLALIPALALLAQAVAAACGYSIDLGELSDRLIAVVNAAFAVLAILGIVADPTTSTLSDSKDVLDYTAPWTDGADD